MKKLTQQKFDMSDDSDDENNKSVILISEVSHKELLECKNKQCKKSTIFENNSLIVKCHNCLGCYHPHCVGMDGINHWLEFMKSPMNREYWQYSCENCIKQVQTMVRIKELALLLSDAVASNHKAIDNKASKIAAQVEILDVGQIRIEKSVAVLSNKLSSLDQKIDVIPKEQEKVTKEMNEISMNNAFYGNKFTEMYKNTKEIEKKIDSIDFMTKKMTHEDGWNLVQNKKKKSPPSYSTVLKIKANKTVDDLKKQMIQNYTPNEFNVTKVITAGKGKMIAICENEEDQKKFADAATEKFNDICEVMIPDKKNRRIKALNVEIWAKFEDLSKEEIEKHIKDENVFLDQAQICKVVNYKKAWFKGKEIDNKIHIFMEVDANTYDVAMNHGKIKYLYQEPRIVDGFTLGRCYNCLSLNHKKEACPVKEMKTCFNCGGDHIRKDCNQANPTCVNCMRANKEISTGKKLDINHSVTDFGCACYIRKLNYLSSKLP